VLLAKEGIAIMTSTPGYSNNGIIATLLYNSVVVKDLRLKDGDKDKDLVSVYVHV